MAPTIYRLHVDSIGHNMDLGLIRSQSDGHIEPWYLNHTIWVPCKLQNQEIIIFKNNVNIRISNWQQHHGKCAFLHIRK